MARLEAVPGACVRAGSFKPFRRTRKKNRRMNTQENKSSSRRRGPRRRHRHGSGSSEAQGESYRPAASKGYSGDSVRRGEEPKPSLLQRILSFFGFGPKKKSYPPYPGGSSNGNAPQRPTSEPTRQRSGASSSQGESTPSAHGAGAPAPRPSRKPEAIEVTTPKLYVGNLSFDATESDLCELFRGVGAVKNVEIVTYRDSEKSKGFGFVTMTALDEAVRAVSELHDKEFMGRRLVVSGSKTTERAA